MQEERRLAAIMFSDICGFSKIMGENEERAIAFASMHKDCIQSGTEIHGGRIIKEMGDGMLVEFASAVNAVRCAIAVQKAVHKYNRTASHDEQFHIRIGIHVGDVVVSGEDILGDGVNVASRIEPLAEPGGICISRDIFDLVRNKISIETVHLGAHDLKNISQQVSIYKILLDAVGKTNNNSIKPRSKQPVYIIAIAVGLVVVGLLVRAGIENRQKRLPATGHKTKSSGQEEIIRQRHIQFVKAVMNKQRDTALSFVPPQARRQGNQDMIWNRLVFMSAIIRLGHITEDDIRVKYAHVSESGRAADVIMQIKKKAPGDDEEIWQDTKPMKWLYIDNNWYIDIPPPKHFEDRQNKDNTRKPKAGTKFRRQK